MLKFRLISAACILVSVYFVTTCLPPVFGLLFILLLASVAQMEFYRFMRCAGIQVNSLLGLSCGVALIVVTMFTIGGNADDLLVGYRWEQVVIAVSVVSIFIAQLFDPKSENPIASVSCTLLGVMYVPYLFNFMTKLAYGFERSLVGISDTGRMLVVYVILVVKMADVGAYFTGRAIGKHKMFPRVSPGKTWEGFAGGIVSSVVASILFCKFAGGTLGVVRLPMFHAVILGFLLSLIGVVGDLFESLLKRSAGTKDSGTKLPGMGGFMDVLDSLLFGVPAFYIYIKLFLESV